MRRIAPFLLLVFVIAMIVVIRMPTSASKKSIADHSPLTLTQNDPVGTIKGAEHPEQIPDYLAYSLMFDLIGGRKSDSEKERMRSYAKQVGLGRQHCGGCSSTGVGDQDVNVLIAAADRYHDQMAAIADQVAALTPQDGSMPSPAARAQIAQVQEQVHPVIDETVSKVLAQLSPEGATKLRNHIAEHVKRRVSIVPAPPMSMQD
jgi:hypothetical protein